MGLILYGEKHLIDRTSDDHLQPFRVEIEQVGERPLATDNFKMVPEVLILRPDNSPANVSAKLVENKPILLGAKLKYVSTGCIYI